MTSDEFQTWLEKHVAAFALNDWLRRNAEVVSSWQDCLDDVSLGDATEATRLMNRGEEEQPKSFGDHARFVRRIAKRLAMARKVEYIGGERVVNCRFCGDSGWVIVANIWVGSTGKAPLKAFLESKHNRLPICGISCSCERGPTFSANEKHYRLPKFDSSRMFVVDGLASDEQNAAEFRQWWAEGRQHGNRVAAFDRWNEGAQPA